MTDRLRSWREAARRTQLRNVSAAHPIFSAIEVIAAHCDAWSLRCSNTIRTARCRTSGENRLGLYDPILSRNGASEKPARSIRVRLATLGSFGKWAVRHGRLQNNPLDQLTRPRRKKRLPAVLKWETIEQMLTGCARLRDHAIPALLAYGGLRRSEVVSVNVGDVVPAFGLRRLVGKGGHEAAVPLPQVARTILSEYVNAERHRAAADDPLFVVRFRVKGGGAREERMRDHRVFKLVKALGKEAGIPKLHPHSFRHSCGVELLRRTHGNLRAVQKHLRHADIQTTTLYTRLTQGDLEKVVSVFDVRGA